MKNVHSRVKHFACRTVLNSSSDFKVHQNCGICDMSTHIGMLNCYVDLANFTCSVKVLFLWHAMYTVYLEISPNELEISSNHLEISAIHLEISPIHLKISSNRAICR